MPRLTPGCRADGRIKDVQISYPLDLKTHMMEFVALSSLAATTSSSEPSGTCRRAL
jgi:hypothetical protein